LFKILEYTNFETASDLKVIISEYIESLGVDISFQEFDKETNDLGALYSKSSAGAFLVAMDNNKIIGCVGLKKIDEESCEMKRTILILTLQYSWKLIFQNNRNKKAPFRGPLIMNFIWSSYTH
jgi:hypothetical protein